MKYNHRNGETKPPEIEGYYWIVNLAQTEGRRPWQENIYVEEDEDRAGVWFWTRTGDTREMPISIIRHSCWYGPIPEPET